MAYRKNLVGLAFLAALTLSTSASAAVVIKSLGASPIDPTAQVHNNGKQSGFSILAETQPGDLGVTFKSESLLSANGNGHAKVSGVSGAGFHDITISGTDSSTLFTAIEFNLPNAKDIFADIVMTYANGLTSTITSSKLSKGENKLVVYDDAGAGFKSITITGWKSQLVRTVDSFAKFDDIRHVDVNAYKSGGGGVGGAVPEPSTWAMMILGFGMIGGVMRRRQRQSLQLRYA